MDEEVMKIVIARLRRWEGQPINQDKLQALRDEIYEKTKTNKFAPFSNVKKWIKASRKEMAKRDRETEKKAKGKSAPSAKAEKPMPVPEIPAEIEQGMLELKSELATRPLLQQEVNLPKPPIVFDKVYLQSMKYEMASMRSALERISKQLDKLEKELQSHGED